MSKKKIYVGRDVLTEAKYRVRHIMATFDQIWVAFSGGKDSLVVLRLVREIMDEDGLANDPVNCLFRDEEVINQVVLDFVNSYRTDPRYNMRYYAIPLKSSKFILGESVTYIQWDDSRKWARPKPEYAITSVPGMPAGGAFSQQEADAAVFTGVPGKIAVLTGIRADESLVRFNSCCVKKNENYINSTGTPNVKLCKPIFDWSEKDVFRYFYDRQIEYCALYDAQVWNGNNLRVATPMIAESAKVFSLLRSLDPVSVRASDDDLP
jgi:predicted phosphoadenosine phosphosulfate sulfurtransferase